MSEIVNPSQETYWIITNGAEYATGITGIGQTTTVGAGWSIWWSGTDYAEYENKCSEVGLLPADSVPSLD
jgi:hypothetical protein